MNPFSVVTVSNVCINVYFFRRYRGRFFHFRVPPVAKSCLECHGKRQPLTIVQTVTVFSFPVRPSLGWSYSVSRHSFASRVLKAGCAQMAWRWVYHKPGFIRNWCSPLGFPILDSIISVGAAELYGLKPKRVVPDRCFYVLAEYIFYYCYT